MMPVPKKYIIAGFLSLAIIFAAFSAHIVLLYKHTVKNEKSFTAENTEMEKKNGETNERAPEKEFIENTFFAMPVIVIAFKKAFNDFRHPNIRNLLDRIPTPPPRGLCYYKPGGLLAAN